jgi:Pectate lyase superfamily protein
MVEEEVIGPFASWGNVKALYGAVGNGVADDTAAIQHALADLGKPGKPQVLYFPAGTYKITATLNLTGVSAQGADNYRWGGVGIIGDSPATTTIKWHGPAGGAMLIQDGGLGTRYSRLTWDGSGTAQYGVAQWWDTSQGYAYGGSSEHQDEVFQDLAIGIMGGRLGTNYGQLDSEGQVRRVTFLRNTYAGVDLGSWNALDWWIWDSHFVDCARGVTNQYGVDGSGTTEGAGAIYVYRSFFQGSTVADMAIGNTGWFSLHNNVSIGSRRFFEASPLGSNPAVIIAENNRVVQSTNAVPIALGNLGPLLLIDNQIAASGATYQLTDWATGRSVLSLGNTVTAGEPVPTGSDSLISVDDVKVSSASISTQAMVLPATPAWTHHAVFEVPEGATADQIQALIDSAAQSGDSLPIVHFGYGTWNLNKSLRIAQHQNVQLVGDGYGSVLTASSGVGTGPMLDVAAPAKITLRDLQWVAASTTAVAVSTADYPGGRIQLVGSQLGPVTATHLEKTQLSLQANPGIASLTFNDVIHAVAMSNGVVGPINLTNSSNFLIADTWYEGSATALFRMDSATFTYLGGHVAPRSATASPAVLLDRFNGTASWLGMQLDESQMPAGPAIELSNSVPQTHAYFMGITSNRSAYFQATNAAATSGVVGFLLNQTANGGASIQAQSEGTTSATAIRSAWSHARSLTWDAAAYQVPTGSVDLRLYHVKMDQTAGLSINGQ